jgi:hypothetical protein
VVGKTLPLGAFLSQLEEPQTLQQGLVRIPASEQARVREPWDLAVASPQESALLEVSHQRLAPPTWAKRWAAIWARKSPGTAMKPMLPLGALPSQPEEPQTLQQGLAYIPAQEQAREQSVRAVASPLESALRSVLHQRLVLPT